MFICRRTNIKIDIDDLAKSWVVLMTGFNNNQNAKANTDFLLIAKRRWCLSGQMFVLILIIIFVLNTFFRDLNSNDLNELALYINIGQKVNLWYPNFGHPLPHFRFATLFTYLIPVIIKKCSLIIFASIPHLFGTKVLTITDI